MFTDETLRVFCVWVGQVGEIGEVAMAGRIVLRGFAQKAVKLERDHMGNLDR